MRKCDEACPLYLYIILVVIGAIFQVIFLFQVKEINELMISMGTLVIYLLLSVIFGIWIASLCEAQEFLASWIVFFIAILSPVIITVVIILALMLFVFLN